MQHRSIRSFMLFLCITTSLAYAHHSFQGTFQSGKYTEVTGVVTDFHFYNPHISVYLDVTNADGSHTQWMSEGLAASSYGRLGWTRDSIKKGDVLSNRCVKAGVTCTSRTFSVVVCNDSGEALCIYINL